MQLKRDVSFVLVTCSQLAFLGWKDGVGMARKHDIDIWKLLIQCEKISQYRSVNGHSGRPRGVSGVLTETSFGISGKPQIFES